MSTATPATPPAAVTAVTAATPSDETKPATAETPLQALGDLAEDLTTVTIRAIADERPARAVAAEVNRMSDSIAQLLVAGVTLSAAVLAIGLAMVLLTGRTGYQEALNPDLILSPQGSVAFPSTIGEALRGALALRPFAILEVGALLLIATPVFRVAASAFLFLAERDRLYAGITVVVLVLLLVSIFRLGA